MTRRMIDSAMWSNENFAALPAMARLLQVGIINMADDQGRVKAFPAYLRSQIFPYDDVSIVDIAKWLQLIAKNGTVEIYQADGKEYIQLLNWWEYQSHQYPAPSEYPAPVGWQDRIRYNAKGGGQLTYNYVTLRGERMPDTCDSRGNPLGYSRGPLPDAPSDNPPGQSTWDTHLDNPPETPATPPNTIQDQLEDQNNPIQELEDEEDARVRDPFEAVWLEHYQEPMPTEGKLRASIDSLVVECGEAAVIHGIQVAAKAKSRTFKYIAESARNYLPPALETAQNANYANGNGRYSIDVPGVVHMHPTGNAPPLPAPMPPDDPWAIALDELKRAAPTWIHWLEGSYLEANGELAGEPFYRIVLTQPRANAEWLTQQAEPAIRKKLSSIIGKRLSLELVTIIGEHA